MSTLADLWLDMTVKTAEHWRTGREPRPLEAVFRGQALAILLLLVSFVMNAQGQAKPNVLFIAIDDLNDFWNLSSYHFVQ